MSELAIRVSDLSKVFYIGKQFDPDTTLITQIPKMLTGPARRMWKIARGQQTGAAELDEEFWALNDINFEIKQGEVVGIIGRNGAGKSTLLKILSRITYPTIGRIELAGRVGSLLEVGTGFHDELTGRENVFLNGTVLGMTSHEIQGKFDEIIEFAGVQQFVDTPVKHYSSGMKVRLAFAVAAHLEPEILLVDEVLSVGDAQFQRKSIGKMDEIANTGRTVLFVSHSLSTIRMLCPRTILLEDGRILADGTTDEVISQYLGEVSSTDGNLTWEHGIANSNIDEFRLYAVRIYNHEEKIFSTLDQTKPFAIEFEYEVLEQLPHCRIGFSISTSTDYQILETYDADYDYEVAPRKPGRYISRCIIPGNLLAPGVYNLSINMGMFNLKNLYRRANVLSFRIAETGSFPFHAGRQRQGVLRPILDWQIMETKPT